MLQALFQGQRQAYHLARWASDQGPSAGVQRFSRLSGVMKARLRHSNTMANRSRGRLKVAKQEASLQLLALVCVPQKSWRMGSLSLQ